MIDAGTIIEAIGGLERWREQCHAQALFIVKTGLLGKHARVARGRHARVRGQHSWVTLGDPYAQESVVLDGTLWCYTRELPSLKVGRRCALGGYVPKGDGLAAFAKMQPPTRPTIWLEAAVQRKLSAEARSFLRWVAPRGLDVEGWAVLANAPVRGWPSREIIGAMVRQPQLAPLVPIDVAGMLTDANPGGLYW